MADPPEEGHLPFLQLHFLVQPPLHAAFLAAALGAVFLHAIFSSPFSTGLSPKMFSSSLLSWASR